MNIVKYSIMGSSLKVLRQVTVVMCYKASRNGFHRGPQSHGEDWDGDREQEKLKRLAEEALA